MGYHISLAIITIITLCSYNYYDKIAIFHVFKIYLFCILGYNPKLDGIKNDRILF